MMFDILELIAAALSFNVYVKISIMACLMITTLYTIEGIMAITIEMMFHHMGHVIEMVKSVRYAPSSSPLKYTEWIVQQCKFIWKHQPSPIGTRVGLCGERIIFGGKGKTMLSSGSPIHIRIGALAQSVLGRACRCWQALCTPVAFMKSCYRQ